MDAELVERLEKAVEALTGATNDFATSMKGLSDESKDLARLFGESSGEMENWASSTDSAAQAAAGLLTIIHDGESGMVGFAKNLFDAATGADNAKFSIDEMALSLKKAFSATKLFATGLTLMAQSSALLTKQMDSLSVSFNKSTGALRMYGSQIDYLEGNMRAANISGEDLYNTYEGLVTNFRQFNILTSTQQKDIAKNTAILSELGISADITAQNYSHLVSALGMTTDEASKQQREIRNLAISIGEPPQRMAESLSSSLPKLMMYGNKSVDMYKKLAINAKAAGMSVESIISATDQFDRFDTAAESVGKMNAYLGGPFLSATKMISETDRVERMRMMAEATRDAGLSFEDMGYHMRNNLASAMGLADVGELALLMRGNFDALAPSANESAASIEAAAMQTAEYNETMAVLRSTFKMFIISLRPALEGVKRLVGAFTGLISVNSELRLGVGLTINAISLYIATTAQGIPIFGQVLGIILAISMAMINIALYVGTLKNTFQDLQNGNALGFLFKMGLYFVLLSNPIGGFIALLMNLSDILSFVGSVIMTMLEPVIGLISYAMASLGKEFERINKVIGPPLMAFFTMLYDMFATLAPVLKIAFLPLIIGLGEAFMALKSVLWLVASALEFISPFFEFLTWAFTGISDGFGRANKAVADFGKGIKNMLKPVKDGYEVVNAFKESLSGVVHSVFIGNSPSVKKAMEYLRTAVSPVTSVVNLLAEAFRTVVSEAKEMATMDFTETANNIGQATARMAYYMSPVGIGIEAGKYAAQRISGANSDKAASNAVQNQQLSKAVNKLSDKVDKMGDIKVEVNNSSDVKSSVKTFNNLAKGKPNYNTGTR